MEFDEKINIGFDEAKAQISKTLQEIKEGKAEIYGFEEARELAKGDLNGEYEDKIS